MKYKTLTNTGESMVSGVSGHFSFSDRIVCSEVLSGVKAFSMKTDIEDVVTFQGSLLGGDVFSPKSNSSISDMTTVMLDKGSTDHDKFAISEALEEVGATIVFGSGMYHVRFGGRCLKKDVQTVIELLAEQLRYPAFKGNDLKIMKKRQIGDLVKLKEDTRAQAMETFLQEIYPESHPNFPISINQRIHDTGGVTVTNLRKFHSGSYGKGHLIIIAVGDVDRDILEKSVSQAFSKWKNSPLVINRKKAPRANDIKENVIKIITMEDKTSVDIIFGQSIGIDRDHDDFFPLMVGQYILGGNFSSRLMSTVRDQQGLTYATGSAIGGVDYGNDGFWCISGTYAPQLIQRGREATTQQLKTWIKNGVTEGELEAKKTTITGSYKVNLATTNGIASRILATIERGKELSYIDQYPDKIVGLTLDQVNRAIKTYCEASNLVTVAAGSINKNWKPLIG